MKRIIFLGLIFLITTTDFAVESHEKIDPKDFSRFTVRYLDHLEYTVPECKTATAPEKARNPHYNTTDYIELIKKKYQAPMYIQFIDDEVGYGVFAEKPIKKGQMIAEYTGMVRPVDFSNKLEDYDYAWGFPQPTKFLVDGKQAGNFTRFINHSFHPNVDMVCVAIDRKWHMVYVARQDIKKDEQLLADYGRFYWQGRSKRPYNLR